MGPSLKVMFYSNIQGLSRTTLGGHLYEVCQDYPTILLAEDIDKETLNHVLMPVKNYHSKEETLKIPADKASPALSQLIRREIASLANGQLIK